MNCKQAHCGWRWSPHLACTVKQHSAPAARCPPQPQAPQLHSMQDHLPQLQQAPKQICNNYYPVSFWFYPIFLHPSVAVSRPTQFMSDASSTGTASFGATRTWQLVACLSSSLLLYVAGAAVREHSSCPRSWSLRGTRTPNPW